jgi:hypothetical protein
MAQFDLLSQVGLVLQSVIEANVPGGTEVRIALPLDDPTGAAAAVRITLLWTTPQLTHRNDPEERNPDGTIAAPPPTLSGFYLITTYGTTPEGNALDAHDLLGRVIRAFHVNQALQMPIDGFGEGRLSLVHMTMEPDLVEKIYTPLQLRLRPWVLYEVAPIQLLRQEAPGAPRPVVRPGGVQLAPLAALAPPRIERITPTTVGEGGRIRIDASYTGDPARVAIGTARIVPPEIVALAPGGPVRVNLPPAVSPNAYDVTLTAANNMSSRPGGLNVAAPSLPSVYAPDALEQSIASDLVLDGGALGANGDAHSVFLWPDSGIGSPADVVELVGTVEGGGSAVRVPAAQLAGLRPRLYRMSVQYDTHLFTPYVLLEMTP